MEPRSGIISCKNRPTRPDPTTQFSFSFNVVRCPHTNCPPPSIKNVQCPQKFLRGFLTLPILTWLVLTCPLDTSRHLTYHSNIPFTCPVLTFLNFNSPDLTCSDLTCADLTCPNLTCPDLTCLDSTFPNLTYPYLTFPDTIYLLSGTIFIPCIHSSDTL